MLSREFLKDLLRHMEWADAKVWSAVPDGTPADKRLTELLLHVHTVQQAFLAVWTKSDVRLVFRGAEEFATLAALRDWARPYYAQAQAHIDAEGRDVTDVPAEAPEQPTAPVPVPAVSAAPS